MTQCRELKALDAMNNSGLWLTLITMGHGFMALNSMNKLGL